MDHLGKTTKEKPTGKGSTEDNINLKPTVPGNLYHYEDGLNMLVRRNHDDFPEYKKDDNTGE